MWVQIEIKSECQGHSVEIKEFFCHYNFTWNQGHRNYYRMINEIENPNNHFLVNFTFWPKFQRNYDKDKVYEIMK